jgi:hypothetical protein
LCGLSANIFSKGKWQTTLVRVEKVVGYLYFIFGRIAAIKSTLYLLVSNDPANSGAIGELGQVRF